MTLDFGNQNNDTFPPETDVTYSPFFEREKHGTTSSCSPGLGSILVRASDVITIRVNMVFVEATLDQLNRSIPSFLISLNMIVTSLTLISTHWLFQLARS